MGFRYLFGPVPSRRLGNSLGIDLIPFKTCSFDCVYCECGLTTHLTSERAEYIPTHEILTELDQFLSTAPELDFLTFSGSGEPTLHQDIGKIVTYIKNKFPMYKIALLTNGSLLYRKELREEIAPIDVVVPSLDAVDETIFQKMNRPDPEITVEKIISGLIDFSKMYKGQLLLEVFIIPGLNDGPEHLQKLKEVIHQVKPKTVQLNSLDRPAAESWVRPSDHDQLKMIVNFLDWPTEVIAKLPDRSKSPAYQKNIENTIIEMIKRRPCTVEDLSQTLGLHVNEINKYLSELEHKELIVTTKMERGIFYGIKK